MMQNVSHFHLLVVDDDQLIIDSLKLLLPKHWRMTAVKNPQLIDERMMFHGAMVDMHLTGSTQVAEGPEVILKLSRTNPHLEIIAMSGDLSIELMEQCLKNGAQKFLAKPLMPDEVLANLEKSEALWMMRQLESKFHHSQFKWIGSSTKSQEIKKKIASFRGEPGPILIEGETGTGKEVACKLLNQQEPNRPFIAVNVAAIPENLFESEMFGHVRGAFSGADQLKIGLAEAAHGGDLFLDEIEALPLTQQVKLLRFLESGEVRKVGSKDAVKVQARVICASNQPLTELVKLGKFREDLLFRLNGKFLQLPPLRDRKDDIAELALCFIDEQKPRINKNFSPEAIEELKKYSWPGNVRELRRICEQLAIVARLPIIRREDVHQLLGYHEPDHSSSSNDDFDLSQGLYRLLSAFEKRLIETAIRKSGDIEQASELLQISRSSLYKKIKDFSIDTGDKS